MVYTLDRTIEWRLRESNGLPIKFLSVDPGTRKMGVCLWHEDKPTRTWLITAPTTEPSYKRISAIMAELQTILQMCSGVTLVVCERAQGFEDNRPAPELQVLNRSIGIWAKKQGLHFETIHPSRVVAAVRLRSFRRKNNKDIIRLGVVALYGEQWRDKDQNVVDSLAVGHCWWVNQLVDVRSGKAR